MVEVCAQPQEELGHKLPQANRLPGAGSVAVGSLEADVLVFISREQLSYLLQDEGREERRLCPLVDSRVHNDL